MRQLALVAGVLIKEAAEQSISNAVIAVVSGQALLLCLQVIDKDYFLTSCKEEFVENARMFIFETYCRIHNCIELKMLAAKLGMDEQSAEKWIVNLIRNARLNAKIDSQAGTVVMNMSFPSPTEQITEKAKDLSMRTFMLANAVVGAPRA